MVRLLPLLTRMGTAGCVKPAAALHTDFTQLKRAILDRQGSTPEGHRRRFRGFSFEEAGRPFAYVQQLLDAVRYWLQSGTNSAVRAAQPSPGRVPPHGGGTSGLGCRTTSPLPQFGSHIPYTGMCTGGYTPSSAGLRL